MSVAIYARVSTLTQVDGTSLDSQIDFCQKKIKELGIGGSIEVFREEGASGENIERPQMDRLRENVKNGSVTHVICTHPDRLSRNLVDKLLVCGEFEKSNVELIFVDTEYKNTPEGQLFFNMQSAIAQYELAQIRKRTVTGRIKAAERGQILPMRTTPYGYEFQDGKLVINEEEAKFVRMVYDWYVYKNLTLREIGEKLHELGAKPRRGKQWNASSIGRILNSETYAGTFYYNRRETKKVKGKTKSGYVRKAISMRDKDDWVSITVPAIIDKALFELAQRQREKNKTFSGNVKHEYMLKSLLRCGHCGRKWQATTYSGRKDQRYRSYRCPNKFPRKYGGEVKKCDTHAIRAEQLEDFIWGIVFEIVSQPKKYIERIGEGAKAHEIEINETIGALKIRFEDLNKQREKLKYMFLNDLITEEEMQRDMSGINKDIGIVENQIKALQSNQDEQTNKLLAKESFESMMEGIQKMLKEELSMKERRHIISLIMDEIVLYFDGDEAKVICFGPMEHILKEAKLSGDIDIESCSQRFANMGY
ncbi:recombinase family protein [Mechercharimyces sp. CAU 1602]|uniref:recombinase family protein n=1 Tax=Mechercharimyces sp. CAU 1602 TaxID=2973933 RepID=UPI0021624F37|nr:recombinase family protein [Mechercharimyces sp. CAU 1602]MCS1350376.1 recombinase family protein [Mechercharimyces sp. CAU 1602]